MSNDKKWLSVIGIEEDGLAGLSSAALELLNGADVIFGGARHLAMLGNQKAKRLSWGVPFSKNMAEIEKLRGQKVVVLATGDPQWFGVGAMLARSFSVDDICTIPTRSSFSLAASAIGWSLNNVQCFTLHGRAFSGIARHVSPRARLLALTKDGQTAVKIAAYLEGCGFGASRIVVMEHLGGENQRIRQSTAHGFDMPDIAALNIVAVECIAGPKARWHSRLAGLPDDAFQHDGQLTKSVVRAATLAALKPFPGAVLWDVGAGCGSIGIEWMRAADDAKAIAIERNAGRVQLMAKNTEYLGVPRLQIVEGTAPGALSGLATPDAIFIGGGLTGKGIFAACLKALVDGGVLVANGVTLESEAKLIALHAKYGGSLTRISVEQAVPMGGFHGWQQAKPVTQWRLVKSGANA
jgi:precorrin-6Y C5,15-methyltransferase (decarboxylating)